MIVLHQFLSGPDRCEYLPQTQATLVYELVERLSSAEYEVRMNAGWRKFGNLLFRPVCADCHECRPIRISALNFTPDRSQRRTLARNMDLTIRFAAPTADPIRLALYNQYHENQATLKGWPHQLLTEKEYRTHFVRGSMPAVEISIWEGDALRAVALTDVTPNTVSGVYHYHDLAYRERGLGTLVMLQTIFLARHLGRPWAYFGYYVAGCGSMAYKARFRPCEILDVDGVWREWADDNLTLARK